MTFAWCSDWSLTYIQGFEDTHILPIAILKFYMSFKWHISIVIVPEFSFIIFKKINIVNGKYLAILLCLCIYVYKKVYACKTNYKKYMCYFLLKMFLMHILFTSSLYFWSFCSTGFVSYFSFLISAILRWYIILSPITKCCSFYTIL